VGCLIPRKVVVTAAGLSTRLLPMTKELPKEMLPIFIMGKNGILLKPLLQALFEQLYKFGFREFCFIVSRGKRSIEDHFTPDWNFIKKLNDKGKSNFIIGLEPFYKMVEDSKIVFINQPEPKGFGHAVLMAEPFIKDEPFLVCAGDTYIISKDGMFINRMVEIYLKLNPKATLLLEEKQDPRGYGVTVTKTIDAHIHQALRVIEKPEIPPSNLVVVSFYIFDPLIMDILKGLSPGVGGEIQLTDAIQKLIEDGYKVYATTLDKDEVRLDVGTPETYWNAIKTSYEYSKEFSHVAL
jgi:UTP--glucose-1-phosphate uridylyltransferase